MTARPAPRGTAAGGGISEGFPSASRACSDQPEGGQRCFCFLTDTRPACSSLQFPVPFSLLVFFVTSHTHLPGPPTPRPPQCPVPGAFLQGLSKQEGSGDQSQPCGAPGRFLTLGAIMAKGTQQRLGPEDPGGGLRSCGGQSSGSAPGRWGPHDPPSEARRELGWESGPAV